MSVNILDQLRESIDYGQGIERCGLGYVLRGDDGGEPSKHPFVVSVNRLRSSGGELRGELRVLVDGNHVSAGSFNLSSLSARGQTAKLLLTKVPTLNWADILERVCVCVLAAEQAGSPVEMIGKRTPTPDERRLLPPLLPVGHPSVMFAPGGAGKSTLAAAIAVSVATGCEVVPGWRPAQRQQVAILDWESSAGDWSNLIAAIAEGAQIEAPTIPYLGCSRPLADDVERLAELVAQHSVGFAVVDSVGLALGIGRDGGDPADAVLRMHQALRHLAVTSLLLDHVVGADLATGLTGASKPYGSVYKLNAARDAWELRREQEPRDGVAEVLLLHNKSNVSAKRDPIGLRIIHSGEVIRFERGEVTAPELSGRLSTRLRMHRALANGAMTTKQLADELAVPETSIRTAISRHPETFQRLPDSRIGLKA